ncbi:hypothetical protein chiPu_0027871, partial [Chiloscyllium punctatum]|nr:hypothetical protein [Chiloscyllium punctatum]
MPACVREGENECARERECTIGRAHGKDRACEWVCAQERESTH